VLKFNKELIVLGKFTFGSLKDFFDFRPAPSTAGRCFRNGDNLF